MVFCGITPGKDVGQLERYSESGRGIRKEMLLEIIQTMNTKLPWIPQKKTETYGMVLFSIDTDHNTSPGKAIVGHSTYSDVLKYDKTNEKSATTAEGAQKPHAQPKKIVNKINAKPFE